MRLTVADDGRGLERDEDHRVFEPYYTARQTSSQPGAVSIGLAVSRQLARMMDRDVTLHRSQDWTMFTLIVPKGEVPDVAAPAGETAQIDSAEAEARTSVD